MPAVTYLRGGGATRVPCAAGESVFEIARRSGIAIATACVGNATCGLCRIKIVAGEAHLPPLNAAERKHLGNVYFINKLRLACQARVGDGEVVVELPGPAPAPGGAKKDRV